MDNDAIVTPILKAINDLRDEVRENRREIKKNSEDIQKLKEDVKGLKEEVKGLKEEFYEFKEETNKHFEKIESKADERWQIYQRQVKQERKYITKILGTFQTSAENMYEENKARIDKVEKRLDAIGA